MREEREERRGKRGKRREEREEREVEVQVGTGCWRVTRAGSRLRCSPRREPSRPKARMPRAPSAPARALCATARPHLGAIYLAGRPAQRPASLRMQEEGAAAEEEPAWPSDSSGAVASVAPPPADLYQCPQCKSPILLDQTACANCGAPIETTPAFVDLTPESTSKNVKEDDFASQATRNPFFTVALSQIGAQLSGQVCDLPGLHEHCGLWKPFRITRHHGW